MAFNFNWSPLTADADFYTRAQDMLTAALNKSPKPPIIVDDIIVNELNLGSVPPELEILEIGDLAEDRFRGIFKMCYSGDAFLTLKTRVQANPLNTYLCSKPSFSAIQPLAASSGLTIPLQITLSEIKLSAFIILVFSRQKGLTLVFRNDPLESLKVSSTFDSIPFVREYLQKEIEGQLRNLFMEDLPAIIHRLSLRLWCPESAPRQEEGEVIKQHIKEERAMQDPFASPPQDAVDAHGNVIDAEEVSQLELDGGSDNHILFSQKNLLRLAALTDSQRTLSLFTPSIRDAVFRAWANTHRDGDSSTSAGATPQLSRTQSTLYANSSAGTTYTFSDHGAEASGNLPSRPSLTSLPSMTGGLSLGSNRHPQKGRRKKNRVVNLRRNKTISEIDTASESGESTTATESSFATESVSDRVSIPVKILEEPEEELLTPPRSPKAVRFRSRQDSIDLGEPTTPRRGKRETVMPVRSSLTTVQPTITVDTPSPTHDTPKQHNQTQYFRHRLVRSQTETTHISAFQALQRPHYERATSGYPAEKPRTRVSSIAGSSGSAAPSYESQPSAPLPGIMEQAWMMKMANEIARHASSHDEAMEKQGGFWEVHSDVAHEAPPAYRLQ